MNEDHAKRINWNDWKVWEGLYQKWVENYGKEKIRMNMESLRTVYEWFIHETRGSSIEELHIELLLDPSMTCEDARKAIMENMRSIVSEKLGSLKQEIKDLKREEQDHCQLRLLVADARQRDVGRGIARVNQRTMQKLNINAGDVIEIVGKRTTSAIAWPAYSEDQNRDIIRIDDFTRKNAVLVDIYIIVKLAIVKKAGSITLAPVDMRLNVDEDFIHFVKNRLIERTLVEGDIILVMTLGHAMQFRVIKTNPKGIVKANQETDLTILPSHITEPTSPIQIELTSINELDYLTVEVEVLGKEYDVKSKSIKLDIALKVKFKDSEQSWKFVSFLNESLKLSDVLKNYKQTALNELESIKNDLRKSCDQKDLLPININLSTIGKTIAERIALAN